MKGTSTNPIAQGLETYATRVEQWECDFNGHWNTRFYGRCFEQADRMVQFMAGERPERGNKAAPGRTWHLRFHRELIAADSARVWSSRNADGREVHALFGHAGLSATAVSSPAVEPGLLPITSPELEAFAAPRGLADNDVDWSFLHGSIKSAIPLGIVNADELDLVGLMTLEALLGYCGRGTHLHRESTGFGPAFTCEHGLAFMLVEMRVSLLDAAAVVGRPLRFHSVFGAAGTKSFTSAHLLESSDGEPLARIELCLLTVDLATRKVVAVPEGLRAR
jgi:acyl-CoA thioester hydrolase